MEELPSPPDPPAWEPGASRVAEIPLFPLDLVLFPHMLMPLHIFEERYKEMINRCLKESVPFGIVLTTGLDPAGNVQTSPIGCSARITRVDHLPDGRMNIEVEGQNRFRILDTHEQFSYRVGLTESYEDVPSDADAVIPLADEVQKLLRDFLTRSLAVMGRQVDDFELPDEPEQLSFTACCVLPIDNEEKQALLVERDTAARLTATREVLHREVTRLRRAAEAAQVIWKPVPSGVFDDYQCPN